jgi:hypothetical protein
MDVSAGRRTEQEREVKRYRQGRSLDRLVNGIIQLAPIPIAPAE